MVASQGKTNAVFLIIKNVLNQLNRIESMLTLTSKKIKWSANLQTKSITNSVQCFSFILIINKIKIQIPTICMNVQSNGWIHKYLLEMRITQNTKINEEAKYKSIKTAIEQKRRKLFYQKTSPTEKIK